MWGNALANNRFWFLAGYAGREPERRGPIHGMTVADHVAAKGLAFADRSHIGVCDIARLDATL